MGSIRHVVSMKTFSRKEIDGIPDLADSLEAAAWGEKESHLLAGKVLATLFYEPSTRTRLSFECATLRLGGQVISVADAKRTSSVWKGETLADTIRTIANYSDVIVLRHPQSGAAALAAEVSSVPILNGGDGANEHPTQALLDLLTIRRERGRIDGLTVALVGDHKHSRVTNSLALALANYDVKLILVNPPSLAVSRETVEYVQGKGLSVEETSDLGGPMKRADVVYIFRIQKERFASPEEYEKVKGAYQIDRTMVDAVGRDITIMHPMPRVDELSPDVDTYPGACYFRQSFNGVLLRMALLAWVLDKVELD
ncbi:MAG TPA: aspartate carbamoyltransferase [Anaerolineae bacterium]|nr:aspartate carbamoyltransferase [Anaerolineae bacterium]